MANEIRNLFVSHVHEDDAILPELKDLLGRRGCEVRDASINSEKPNDASNPEYIKSGILAPQIRWAGAMIVLISPDTHKSEWVNWEIEYAAKEGKPIIGVFVRGGQDSDVPEALQTYADAVVGWNAERVIDALDGKIKNWTNADGTNRGPVPIERYSC